MNYFNSNPFKFLMMKFLNTSLLTSFLTTLIISFFFMQAIGQDGLPPIIDRDIFFGNPEISTARLSPDGNYISFIKPYNDVRNIWVKKIDDKFEDAKPITADTERPIRDYFWSRDGKRILYVQDKGGDENFHVYSVDPAGPNDGDTGVPSSIDLTPMDGIRAFILDVPKSNKDIIHVGINDRDKAWHDYYQVNITTGEKKIILKNEDELSGIYFDLEGNVKMTSKATDDGGTEYYKITKDGSKLCYSCNVQESCYPSQFSKDGRVYFVSNKGDVDLTRLGLLNLETDEFVEVESDPKGKVDFGYAIFSDRTDELIGTSYTGEKETIYWRDKGIDLDYKKLKQKYPEAEITITSWTEDEQIIIYYVNSDTDPGAAYIYNRKTGKSTFLYRPRPNLPTEHLTTMTPITYKSKDGLEIPGYLTLPKGVEAKNLPTVVMPHGGPWARDFWGYNSFAQFFANRGYAVIQSNFRGSTGYGKAFLNAGNNEWGEKMQDDLTAAVDYLVEKGIADPDKVAIMGGSYGGYATLAGLTFTPDVYAAGVSVVGPSNLFTLLETIPPYWESYREVFHQRMGDPDTPEGKEQMRRQSPFFHAKNIKAPLLVAQGANDPRVKKAESDQIVIAMREEGLPVEYLNFPDEGHGFANPDNNIAFISSAEKFLATHIGGRYQEDIPSDIQDIVANVTVDINTVELPTELTAEEAIAALPTPTRTVIPGDTPYNVTIEIGPQKIPMEMTRTIKESGDHWVITDKVTSPMGDMVDECTIEKGTFAPVKREMNQGPATVQLEHSETSIKGVMTMQGKETPIESKLDASVFSDGSGLGVTLASLPLKEGYSTMYRTFDPMKHEVKTSKLIVVGIEDLEVGGSSHSAYKIEVEAMDGSGAKQHMWFDANESKMLKLVANLPEMGGAKMTIELK